MKDLSPFFKEHRESFLAVGTVVAAAILFSLLVVGPVSRRAGRLQKEIADLKSRIARVVPPGSAVGSFEDVILEKHKELAKLQEGLPQQERISEILKNLSQRATELGVTVVSVRPQLSQPYPSPQEPLRVEGQVCYALPIQMQIECSYRTLGKYLESLTENFPSVVTVDDLEVRREEGKLSNLKVSLVVTSYVFESE